MKKLFSIIVNALSTFYHNRWHLHSLTFVLTWYALIYIKENPWFMQIGYSGRFLQGFLAIGCSAALGYTVEWCQGKFFGANSLPLERRASNWDMLVSTIAGAISMIIFFSTHKV